MKIIKPNFFIVGAMKAGTTTMYEALVSHPEIYMPFEKEPCFFNWLGDARKLEVPQGEDRKSSADWQYFDSEEKYLNLFRNFSQDIKVAGEASTFYLPDLSVAERIYAFSPGSKIIIILRNPVDRAYSSYMFQKSFGAEHASSFRESLIDELKGNRNNLLYGWRHIYCGMYSTQVENYLSVFGARNVKVIYFEDLILDVESAVEEVCNFLGVTPELVETKNKNKVSNKTIVNKGFSGWLITTLLHDQPKAITQMKSYLPIGYRRKIKSKFIDFIRFFGSYPERLSKDDREFAEKIFVEDIIDLEKVLGVDLEAWKP
jgi:hypothetical protein